MIYTQCLIIIIIIIIVVVVVFACSMYVAVTVIVVVGGGIVVIIQCLFVVCITLHKQVLDGQLRSCLLTLSRRFVVAV